MIGGAQELEEEAKDERGPEDEPAALVPMPEVDEDEDAGDVEDSDEVQAEVLADTTAVALAEDKVPEDLSPARFFETLIRAALDRMPVAIYPEVRHRMRAASTTLSG